MADSLLAFVRSDETTAPWYAIGPLGVPPHTAAATAPRAWPNPARTSVTIGLPAAPANLVRVMDAHGALVRTLAEPAAGRVTWDLRDAAGRRVSAGVYWAVVGNARVRVVVQR